MHFGPSEAPLVPEELKEEGWKFWKAPEHTAPREEGGADGKGSSCESAPLE